MGGLIFTLAILLTITAVTLYFINKASMNSAASELLEQIDNDVQLRTVEDAVEDLYKDLVDKPYGIMKFLRSDSVPLEVKMYLELRLLQDLESGLFDQMSPFDFDQVVEILDLI